MADGAYTGQQQVYAELLVTSVMMKGRAVHRRITERIVTARADAVDGYFATSVAGWHGHETDVPVRALWGCNVDRTYSSVIKGRVMTKLVFPRALRLDEHHYFASEVIDNNLEQDRLWVNVEVDHHGIAAGRLHGRVPVSGLVIRIQFDDLEIPDACWWYAEQGQRQRRLRPPDRDRHLIPIIGGAVEHIFTQECISGEDYGLSFSWPAFRSMTEVKTESGAERYRSNSSKNGAGDDFDFDVAISFAGADRPVAKEIYVVLKDAGYRVFYDAEQQHRLLGSDLTEFLHDTYFRRSRYAVIVVSANFMKSKWASNWEWRAVLARMQSQEDPYVLPYLLDDDAILPGLSPTIGYASLDQCQPRDFARLVIRKLRVERDGGFSTG